MSTLAANFAEVCLASLIIPAVISIDKIDWIIVILGLTGLGVTVYFSVRFAERGKL